MKLNLKENGKKEKSIYKCKNSAPALNILKLGIVSKDYNFKYGNGYKDFSYALSNVLKMLDNKDCDAVLFSPYSIQKRKGYSIYPALKKLRNIKSVMIEEYRWKKQKNKLKRKSEDFIVYYRSPRGWNDYRLQQIFSKRKKENIERIERFVKDEMPKRILGNSCLLICGETNGVIYSKKKRKVLDKYGIRAAIPKDTKTVINPIHDRMTRFEMKLKRRFLSKSDRWVVSVWNKGKIFKDGKTRDGDKPAWTVFHNGKEIELDAIPNDWNVEIGIIDF